MAWAPSKVRFGTLIPRLPAPAHLGGEKDQEEPRPPPSPPAPTPEQRVRAACLVPEAARGHVAGGQDACPGAVRAPAVLWTSGAFR